MLDAGLLAGALTSALTIWLSKGSEEVVKQGFGDLYEKLKSVLAKRGAAKAATEFQATPDAASERMKEEVAGALRADPDLAQEVEQLLRRHAVIRGDGSVNIGSITADKVVNAGDVGTINM